METDFCIEASEETLTKYGKPDIFNSDQGSQFTSPRFTEVLSPADVRISVDGRGRWMDNVFIERLWRSLKYECVYLHVFETGSDLQEKLAWWVAYYNARRPHSALAGRHRTRRIIGSRCQHEHQPGNSLNPPGYCPTNRSHLRAYCAAHYKKKPKSAKNRLRIRTRTTGSVGKAM